MSFKYMNGLMKLECESKMDLHLPNNETLIIVDLKDNNDALHPTFGIITKYKTHKDISNSGPDKKFQSIIFSVYVKSREINVKLNCLMNGSKICDLENKIRLTHALNYLRFSPLMNDILSPTLKTFSATCSDLQMDDFRPVQNAIGSTVCNILKLPANENKIILLEGPPGSGKTAAIIHICDKLIDRYTDYLKILIAAPSNYAIDAIANQFKHLNDDRVFKITVMRFQKESFRRLDKEEIDDINVILATLDDCFDLLKSNIKFLCCFIDEANQATEPEILFTFMSHINKFIIICDGNQFPPIVKSELAAKYGLQQSIFKRFKSYFEVKFSKSPVISLTSQFRMPQEVAKYPLTNFYSLDYTKHSHADYRSEKYPLIPYTVLHYEFLLKCANNLSQYDKTGCSVILELCSCILRFCPVMCTGIIVPSKTEKDLYLSMIEQNLNCSNIEVGTIDDFQGRERAIIILSCFYESLNNKPPSIFTCKKTLNVALTRATHALIICGPLHFIVNTFSLWSNLKIDAQYRERYLSFSSASEISGIFKKCMLKAF